MHLVLLRAIKIFNSEEQFAPSIKVIHVNIFKTFDWTVETVPVL